MSDEVSGLIDSFMTRDKAYDPYYFWEPFDPAMPSQAIIDKARDDGVDLLHDEATILAGQYPRQFQTGFVQSTKKVACIQASSQSGKSMSNFVLIGASISRKPPYSLRYEKGADTGIQRVITPQNIRRYGRRDAVSGTVIDFNESAPLDLGEWTCGNIEGAGIFPEELYCPEGDQIWIGTLPRSIDTYWWKGLCGRGMERFLPLEFLDLSRGNKGSDKGTRAVYGPRDTTIFVKSYDANRETFETTMVHLLLFDEEPSKVELYSSGVGHSRYQRWSFTPFKGYSFSYGLFFGCISQAAKDVAADAGVGCYQREDFDFFHATQYDSPYQDPEKREMDRLTHSLWERKALVWGRYSRQQGQAFFDRNKIEIWTRRFCPSFIERTFEAETPYHGAVSQFGSSVPGIINVKVGLRQAEDGELRAWRVYEPVRKNVGYLAVFDAAEGGVDPATVQDRSFGAIYRLWQQGDPIEWMDIPILCACIRTTLPTVAFARSALPCLRYYNNANLAAERGHGKDNEGFGLTLDEWPYWYTNTATTSNITRKGFDTNASTRSTMFEFLQDWVRNFDVDTDPGIRDSVIYGEMAEAVVKVSANGKNKCDHPKKGSLDGVICLGIAMYILRGTPEAYGCNQIETDEKREGFAQRMGMMQQKPERGRIPMGAGVGTMGAY